MLGIARSAMNEPKSNALSWKTPASSNPSRREQDRYRNASATVPEVCVALAVSMTDVFPVCHKWDDVVVNSKNQTLMLLFSI